MGYDTSASGTLLAAMLCCIGTAATIPEAHLTIINARAQAGSTMQVSVVYQPNGTTVAALQFDLAVDQAVLRLTSSALSGAPTKTLSTAVLPNGRIRFLIAGVNQTPLNDGAVVLLNFEVAAAAKTGNYPLVIYDAVGSSPASPQAVPMSVQSGAVQVTGAKR